MGIRLVVIDDNPHLAWGGAIYPANATFERFVAALLDLPGSPVASITTCVPVRDADARAGEPAARPADPGRRARAPFDGIAGLPAPPARRCCGPTGRRCRGRSPAPTSSGSRCPRRTRRWPGRSRRGPGFRASCGSPGARPTSRPGASTGARGVGGRAVGAGYDVVGRLVGLGGRRLVVGEGVVDGDGVVASLVEPSEVRDPASARLAAGRSGRDPARLGGPAGRAARGSRRCSRRSTLDRRLTLDILGDGPDRDRLRAIADASGARDRITWAGHVAERAAYLDRLAAADVFVFPSPAEGFPKVVLDAFAVGLPVVATRAGALAELADARLIEPIARAERGAIHRGLGPSARSRPMATVVARRGGAAHAFAAAHTRPAEAARLVEHWRRWWPDLPWDDAARADSFGIFLAHPVLFQLILGAGFIGGLADEGGRILTALFGVGTVGLAWLIARSIGGRALGSATGLLLAVLAYDVYLSRLVLLDGPAAFAVAGSLYALLRAARERSGTWLAISAGVLGMAVLTKELAVLILPAVGLAAVVDPRLRLGTRAWLVAAATFTVVVAAFLLSVVLGAGSTRR